MKKSFMYLMTMMMVAMLSVGFASCGSDDDDSNSSYSRLIVGTWKMTHQITYDADGNVKSENNRESTWVDVFNADGTYITTDGYNSESAKWSISGNRLSLKYGRETETETIKSLTESTMVLQYDEFKDGRVEVTTYKRVKEEIEEE